MHEKEEGLEMEVLRSEFPNCLSTRSSFAASSVAFLQAFFAEVIRGYFVCDFFANLYSGGPSTVLDFFSNSRSLIATTSAIS